jgi:hypothetical protein
VNNTVFFFFRYDRSQWNENPVLILSARLKTKIIIISLPSSDFTIAHVSFVLFCVNVSILGSNLVRYDIAGRGIEIRGIGWV